MHQLTKSTNSSHLGSAWHMQVNFYSCTWDLHHCPFTISTADGTNPTILKQNVWCCSCIRILLNIVLANIIQIYCTYGVYYLYHELLCNNLDKKFRITWTFEQKSYIVYIIIQPTAIPITTFTKLNLHQIQSNLPLNLFCFICNY